MGFGKYASAIARSRNVSPSAVPLTVRMSVSASGPESYAVVNSVVEPPRALML
jgi:hypothetical protein